MHSSSMIVMKFGGTSVGSRDALLSVASIVMSALHRNPLIVVSAASGVTDTLLSAAREAGQGRIGHAWNAFSARQARLLDELGLSGDLAADELHAVHHLLEGIAAVGELSVRCQDLVLSYGERISARVVAAFLTVNGMPASARMAWDMGMITDARFGCARPVAGSVERMQEAWRAVGDSLVVTTGFIGRDTSGSVTTLGRGGSDLSASIFGAALDAEEIQIWTDVCGILTADPRVVQSARVLSRLPFSEAAELAACGAKVLHPETLEPAASKAIPVRVKNTFNADAPGTLIVADCAASHFGPMAIAARHDMSFVTLHDRGHLSPAAFLEHVLHALDGHAVSPEVLTTGHSCISFVTDAPSAALRSAAESLGAVAAVQVSPGRSLVSMVGQDIEHTCGVAGKIFGALGQRGINVEMISQGASETSITFVVSEAHCEAAMRILHAEVLEHAAPGPVKKAGTPRLAPLPMHRTWTPRRPRRSRGALKNSL